MQKATRDYIDFVALSDHLGFEKTKEALKDFDKIYPQENNASALRQLSFSSQILCLTT